jgi:hypothetical protein
MLATHTRKHALAYTCLWSLRWEVLYALVPKFLLVGLNLSQAYLIQGAVDVLQDNGSGFLGLRYGLVGGFAVVYLGLAVRFSEYFYILEISEVC